MYRVSQKHCAPFAWRLWRNGKRFLPNYWTMLRSRCSIKVCYNPRKNPLKNDGAMAFRIPNLPDDWNQRSAILFCYFAVINSFMDGRKTTPNVIALAKKSINSLMIIGIIVRAMALESAVSVHQWSCLSLQNSKTKWPTAGFSHQTNLVFWRP